MKPTTYLAALAVAILVIVAGTSAYLGARHNVEHRQSR